MLFGMRTSTALLYYFFWVIPRRLNFTFRRFGTLSIPSSRRHLPIKMELSVLKRRHMKFRARGITQKKEYNIQSTVKVWNQEALLCFKLPRFRRLAILILLLTWRWVWSNGGIMTGKIMKYSHKKKLSHCQLTTNTRTSQVSNSCFRGKRPTPNSLSHGMTLLTLQTPN